MKDTMRLTAADFHLEVRRLYGQYVHGSIDEAAAKVAWSKTVALFNRVSRG